MDKAISGMSGESLDLLVWENFTQAKTYITQGGRKAWLIDIPPGKLGLEWVGKNPPPFSRSIDISWRIAETIQSPFSIEKKNGYWVCSVLANKGEVVSAEEKTASQAICKAALLFKLATKGTLVDSSGVIPQTGATPHNSKRR